MFPSLTWLTSPHISLCVCRDYLQTTLTMTKPIKCSIDHQHLGLTCRLQKAERRTSEHKFLNRFPENVGAELLELKKANSWVAVTLYHNCCVVKLERKDRKKKCGPMLLGDWNAANPCIDFSFQWPWMAG